MIEIAFSPSFKRAFRKKIRGQPGLQAIFWQKVGIFKENPFDGQILIQTVTFFLILSESGFSEFENFQNVKFPRLRSSLQKRNLCRCEV